MCGSKFECDEGVCVLMVFRLYVNFGCASFVRVCFEWLILVFSVEGVLGVVPMETVWREGCFV